MSNIVIASVGLTPGKTLGVDADGYTKLRLGSFNVFNSIDEYYPLTEDVEKILTNSSDFMNTISEGKLYSELEHPEYEKGMSASEYIRRNLFVDGKNMIGHFKKIELVKSSNTNSRTGDPIYDVYGWVKPFGPHKAILEDSLANDNINTAFSLRCLYKEVIRNGITYRDVKVIITYDFVTRNGVEGADKFTIGKESKIVSEDLVSFTEEEFKVAIRDMKQVYNEVGIESGIDINVVNELSNLCSTNPLFSW